MTTSEKEQLIAELAALGLRIASQDESGWYYGRSGVWVTNEDVVANDKVIAVSPSVSKAKVSYPMALLQITKTLTEGYAELLSASELNQVVDKCYKWGNRLAFNLACAELKARGL